MPRADLLLRTKLAPPRPHKRILPRTALIARLREALDSRLTLVQAGTGYGKSTALAALADENRPLFWYSLDEADADPQRFLSYLVAAFELHLPQLSAEPAVVLQEISGAGSGAWAQVIDALVNALSAALITPALLVIDDYQFVADTPEINALVERFLVYRPPDLHVILTGRHVLNTPQLIAWRAKGEVLEIGRAELAFRADEIAALFRDTYAMQLSPDDIVALADKTEGWPIALHLVWQSLRSNTADSVRDLLARGPASLSALFAYLAHDVLDRQSREVADFLRATAVLRELTPAACDAVTASTAGMALLNRLGELDLFVVALGEKHYRYHHLFHDFLREQAALDPIGWQVHHRRAAVFFAAGQELEEAIYHWLAAQSYGEAAEAIEQVGEATLRSGRMDTVANWIDALPPEVLADHPALQAFLGDVYRLRSSFDAALAWYASAEHAWRVNGDVAGISRALRGQALVYLDTVRPAQAESLLEEALRLTDGMADRSARARLLELLAENKLNMGKPGEAEALRVEAQQLRAEGPAEDTLSVRVKLRTGRLDEAQHLLEMWASHEREAAALGQTHSPRAHRETVLILSLIQSLRGQVDRAFESAQEGMALGERLNSPFVTAVGQIRLGHAWQLRPPARDMRNARDEAVRCYQSSIVLGDRLLVRRIRAEAMWGLTRAYGFFGDLAAAQRAAAEGIEIGLWAGDLWIAALIEVTLGASHVLADRSAEAIDILSLALSRFRSCGDTFGRAVARLWLSLAYFNLKQRESLLSSLDELLTLCETHGYEFLFSVPTLLGPSDPRTLTPILIEARNRRCHPAYAAQVLAAIGLPDIAVHPGYQLRMQTLGAFRVWRSAVEIAPREWQRDKARQLFQLLLTQRGRWLQREEIVDRLWPNLAPEAAQRDFKVALNALNKAIEPQRSADDVFAFVVREGSAYRLRPEADVWVDAIEFEQACEAGLRADDLGQLRSALRLYRGDYLPDALYEDWASEERERLLSLYLRAADKLAGLLIEQDVFDEALDICQAILARDAYWERAYRLMMIAHARQGNRPLALRAYQRCVTTLRDELGVEPSAATTSLYRQIAQSDEDVSTAL
jgi:ATP/maltotriose-dependent transcriptional regulator MalT/DNA-binding SARP family transcriptional activator